MSRPCLPDALLGHTQRHFRLRAATVEGAYNLRLFNHARLNDAGAARRGALGERKSFWHDF